MLKGAFLPAMRLAYKFVKDRVKMDLGTTESDKRELEDYLTSCVSWMMQKMRIQLVPWHLEAPGGTQARAVRADWWLCITHKPEDVDQHSQELKTREEECTVIASAVSLVDHFAPWDLPTNLHQMGELWQKKVRPSEWKLEHASITSANAPYIVETYEYVNRIYSGDIWWHHMAIIWAILFSRITPFLFRDRTIKITGVTKTEITTQIRLIPWTDIRPEKQKGCTMPLPYITMLSTTIIAMLDKASPLWKNYQNGGFGSQWSDKHGRWYTLIWKSSQLKQRNYTHRDEADQRSELDSNGTCQGNNTGCSENP